METYFNPADLARFGEMGNDVPELWKKFMAWYGAVYEDGALSEREKALIALAVAHVTKCPYCIEEYSNKCLEKGADIDQMTEAVHVASVVSASSTMVMGVQMRNHVEKVSM